MKGRVIYTVLLLWLTGVIHAQRYSITHDHGSNFAMYAGSFMKSDSLYVFGTVADPSPPYKNLHLLTGVDLTSGTTVNPDLISLAPAHVNMQEFCFAELPAKGYAMGGLYNYNDKTVILYYDSLLTLMDTVIIEDTTALGFYPKDLLYKDSALYFLIYRQELDYDGNTWVVKLDLDGNIIWQQSYGISSMSETPGCIIDLDTCILIGSSRSTKNHQPTTIEEESHTWLFTIDTAGVLQDEWLDPDDHTYWPDKMLVTPAGNIVMAGGYRGNYIWSNYNEVLWKGYFAEFDLTTWNKSWWKTYGTANVVTYFHDIDTVNGNYLLSGSDALPPVLVNPPAGWLVKVDTAGEILWERRYLPFSASTTMNSVFRESHVLPGGDIVSVGWGDNGSAFKGWIVRTDEFGCLVPGCHTIGVEEENVLSEIKAYPNPTEGIFSLRLSDSFIGDAYLLTDMQGRQLQTGSITSVDPMFDLSLFKPGVYFLYINGENHIEPIKIIKL